MFFLTYVRKYVDIVCFLDALCHLFLIVSFLIFDQMTTLLESIGFIGETGPQNSLTVNRLIIICVFHFTNKLVFGN